MSVFFHTFGCKLNQAESQELKEKLIVKHGTGILSNNKKFDYCLISACCVTNKAAKETRQLIRHIKKNHPSAKIIVTGCWTEETFQDKSINKQVDVWFKNNVKHKIIELFDNCKPKVPFAKQAEFDKIERTRVFVKIQHGCNNYCSYCVVPFLRPDIYSKRIEDILKEINFKNQAGVKEVVLVGTNIGEYKYGLVELLKQILVFTNIPRIRISSLWPTLLSDELINLIKQNKRICPHIHLSVQSASNRILSLMKRNYTQTDLIKVVNKIKQISNITISADIIVGFPSATDEDFLQTYNFVKLAEFSKIHVFRYSPKKNTASCTFDKQVDSVIKKTRAQAMRNLGDKLNIKNRKKYIGKVLPVLFEEKKDNFYTGFTPNYIKVYLKTSNQIKNKILKVELIKLYKNGLIAKKYD
ncbi:tRNA (N(6)-L-threonylcarbamoyladenosine(37)-C(2))-methylthiotransferase MtaB [Patescibacteria group bacterium]|nr:tRNA (N(6)-L-threonylcarbamoyladenosine(37)-C(2))-methylthiotransferase MtaB [Patescibacteria group bacterium]